MKCFFGRNARLADRAYTLFNDATLKNEVPFRLKISSSGDYQEPDVTSVIHQVRNLPLGPTNHSLYDLFRRFGPMSLCKIIMDHQGKGFKGTALIQYFNENDVEMAIKTMVGCVLFLSSFCVGVSGSGYKKVVIRFV